MERNEKKSAFEIVESYIKENTTLILATSRNDTPRATPLVYKYRNGNFLIVSEEGKKFENLNANKRVSFAIADKYTSFGTSKGLQGEGKANVITAKDENFLKLAEEYGLKKSVIEENGLQNFLKIIEIIPSDFTYMDSTLGKGFRIILSRKDSGEGFDAIYHHLEEIDEITVERYYPEEITKENPILFIHGAFHGSWCYHHFQKFFARLGYNTYAVNWKGHYLSKPDKMLGKRSIIDAVEDCEKTAKKLFTKLPILVGHSMGALISLIFAERNETKLAVLLDGAPYRKIFLDAGLDKVMTREGIESNFEISDDYRFTLSKEKAAQNFFDENLTGKDEMERYLSLVQEESGTILVDVFTGKIEVNKERIKCPLYILGKTFSPTKHRLNEMKAKDLGAKDCKVFENMTHDMMLERDWQRYASIILNWIENETQC